ncbi:hypothetical protein CC85DRAFT_281999 [Cutaneotrichosporon oleaginosum]|uniref:Xylanolytic transcriptional activator regulatory domain-containing protein n=1 Tax=Cutaneotrichosporon oleaginosum TaxID=879819 RepID=A0A0J0XXQ2_9TREE|nr:uncharacterized protein CC85DRAFT_281999 [Cutaneotrichosporon oleaginosum]KLT45847.1 hypothetical protein CC85DRAFT_281999 [Cutaneotrichosporon oleaginosum]TXT06550.1 hypothetical protein COLE_05881 [Cutaneotrichosporon oleaginosum]
MSPEREKKSASASCDRCRSRKVKCHPLSDEELETARARGVGDRCRGCFVADKECTHHYVHKKPGRPLGSSRRRTPVPAPTNSAGVPLSLDLGAGPVSGSIFGSARTALYPFPMDVPLEVDLSDRASGGGELFSVPGPSCLMHTPALASSINRPTSVANAPELATPRHSTHTTPVPLDGAHADADLDGRSLDAVLPWADATHFLHLFLRDQHCLVPVVHAPTFGLDLLKRRDRKDEAFRGLLCSMISFTICQCPISVMTDAYERARLVDILYRCIRAADAIRHRQRLLPSLELLASTLLDGITAQAVGRPVTDMLVAEVTRLAHSLNLNESQKLEAGPIETQIRRRLYWIMYCKDKTEALSGRPVMLHDFEGVAPHPLLVDDEYITPAGHLPQPEVRPSVMVGFVVILRIFQVISGCVARHRAFANRPRGEPSDPSSLEEEFDEPAAIRWIEGAQARLRAILSALPPALCMDLHISCAAERADPCNSSLYRIQQANISITALCAEFALLDFRACLRPDEDTRAEREEQARKAYATLSGLPLEYLASNGESMRGKVLRIILALLHTAAEPVNFSQNMWDWWNIYSRVQFLQVVPDEGMMLVDGQVGV